MAIYIDSTFQPSHSGDTYPLVESQHLKGSAHAVQTIVDRDSIPDLRREEGLICYVVEDLTTYQLQSGITNTDWVEFGEGVSTLSGLTDTTIDNLVSGDTLIYSGGSWINSLPVTKYIETRFFNGLQTITHNLNDVDVIVQIKDDNTGELIIPDYVDNYTLTTVDINITVGGNYRIIIIK